MGLLCEQETAERPPKKLVNLEYTETPVQIDHQSRLQEHFTSYVTIRLSNLNGVLSKSPSVKIFCSFADITGLTETWDKAEYADKIFADLRTFNVFRRPRSSDAHGGVALVVKKSLKASRRHDLEHPDLELLLVEISALSILVGVFYGPPSKIRMVLPLLLDHISEAFTAVMLQKLVLMGDFNLPDISWATLHSTASHSAYFLSTLKEWCMKQVVSFPTRLENTLDLILVPTAMLSFSEQQVSPPLDANDHSGVEIKLRVRKRRNKDRVRFRWKIVAEKAQDF